MYILGVRLDLLSKEEVEEIITRHLLQADRGLCVITTVNAECIALASKDPTYREVVNQASLNIIDGAGVAWIARLRGYKPVPRLPGADLIYDLARLCQAHGRRLFLLGAAPDVALAAQRRLQALYPGLAVEAHSPPPLATERLPTGEERALFQRLAAFSPQVLWVALGMPKQERWIHTYRKGLEEVGVGVAIGVGGALAFLAGAAPRAPAWMRRAGLEWLFRLLREPHRRLPRQATRLPRFLLLASLEAWHLRLRGESGQGDRS